MQPRHIAGVLPVTLETGSMAEAADTVEAAAGAVAWDTWMPLTSGAQFAAGGAAAWLVCQPVTLISRACRHVLCFWSVVLHLQCAFKGFLWGGCAPEKGALPHASGPVANTFELPAQSVHIPSVQSALLLV